MGITKDSIHSAIFYFSLLLATVTFPFTYWFSLPIVILLLLNWIAEWNWKEKIKRINTTPANIVFVLCIAFFLLHVIGIFYSTDKVSAVSALEYKIWFFVAPLIFLTLDVSWLPQKRIKTLMTVFICSCLVLIVLNLGLSMKSFMNGASKYVFFYIQLSHYMHPTYSAMHICTACLCVFYLLFLTQSKPRKSNQILLFSSLPVFVLYIHLLQSKAGLITIVFIVISTVLYLINRKKRRIFLSFSLIGIIFLMPFIINKITAPPVNRMQRLVESLTSENRNTDDPNDGTLQRIAIWKVSARLAIEKLPFGVGTGDVEENLTFKYKEAGFSHILYRKANCHNQYLQTTVGLGIPGLLLLLAVFFVALYDAIKKRNIIQICFIGAVLINMIAESMLERKAGSDFIVLILCLFAFSAPFSRYSKGIPSEEKIA